MSQLPKLSYLQNLSQDKAKLDKFIDTITHAFLETALGHTFIVEIDNTPPPYPSPSIDFARRRRHFEAGITSAAESNAIFVTAGEDWSAVAIWEPPGFEGKPFVDVVPVVGPMRADWKEKINAAKVKYLSLPPGNSHQKLVEEEKDVNGDDDDDKEEKNKLRPYYHLSFLGRNPTVPKVPGAISAVVQPFLDKAVEENMPVWLEATTPYAVSIYEHFGFRLVETVTLGIGIVGEDGWPKENGEGINGYFMIMDGHLKD